MTAVGRDDPASRTPVRIEQLVGSTAVEHGLLAEFGLDSPATPPTRELHFLAYGPEGQARGAATLRPASDDADCLVAVGEHHRRRGVGTALLRACAEGAQAHGYSQLFCTATDGTPSAAFLDQHGFRTESAMNRLRLRLPGAPEPVTRVRGYEVQEWTGTPPQQLGPALLDAKRRSGDLPAGGSRGVLHDPAKALGMMPNRVQRLGNVLHTVAVLEQRTGAIVGYTELVVIAGATRAEQANTIVLPEHRGHDLGTMLKTAMLDRIAWLHPEVTAIETENAADNVPMLTINVALGFEIVSCTRRRWAYTHSFGP